MAWENYNIYVCEFRGKHYERGAVSWASYVSAGVAQVLLREHKTTRTHTHTHRIPPNTRHSSAIIATYSPEICALNRNELTQINE